MSRPRPSIHEVAALAGVSTATVSNVFSGRKPVNSDRKSRVLNAAERLGYQVDPVASQLRSGRARIVAVLVPDLTDTFFATIVSHLETMASKEHYDVIVASSHDNPSFEASRLKALLSWRPAGLILIPCSAVLPPDFLEIADRVPIVLADRVDASVATADTVTIDNFEAGEIAGNHLTQRGHRDIVIAASDLTYPPIKERANGATRTIASRTGLAPRVIELGSNVAEGSRVLSDWIAHNRLPTAIFALTNVTALSVLSALAEHRVLIPEGMSIVAFDDYAWMAARNTGLTAIRQPVDEIAAAAWERLQQRLVEGAVTEVKSTVLKARLVVRDSVKDVSSIKVRTVSGRTSVRRSQSTAKEKTGAEAHTELSGATNATRRRKMTRPTEVGETKKR